MATRILNVLLRVALLSAVVASAVLFVDYGSATPAVCGGGGGCAAVRDSAFSHIGPVSLPIVGLAGFLAVFGLSLFATTRRHFAIVAGATGLAAIGALVLIGLQLFVIGAVCRWCMGVDTSALVAFGCAVVIHRRLPREDDAPGLTEKVAARVLWSVAGLGAAVVPMLWDYGAAANTVAVSDGLQKFQQPGMVNVVMFTDFECPYCRKLHAAMEEARPTVGDKLNLVRLMNPLSFHAGAKPAALAYLCTPEDKREEAAHAFYKADPAKLTPQEVALMVGELGADPDAVAACMADPATSKQIEHEKALAQEAGLTGVPTTFVNAELVRGADIPLLRSALDRAQGGDGGGSDVVWMFAFIAILVGAAGATSLAEARSVAAQRARRGKRSSDAPPPPSDSAPSSDAA